MLPKSEDFRATLAEVSSPIAPSDFDSALVAARAEVMHRLALSLLREGLISARETARSGQSVRFTTELPRGELSFEFSGTGDFLRFGRLERCDIQGEGTDLMLQDPVDLLDWITPRLEGVDADAARELRRENDNCVANLALGLAASELKRAGTTRPRLANLKAWIDQFSNNNDSMRRALEGEVHTGHRLHVCAKTRRGMSPSDVMRYSPELCSTPINVRWVALHKRAALSSGAPLSPILSELWPSATLECRREMESLNLSVADHQLLPVHPWQYEESLKRIVAPKLSDGDLVFLSTTGQAYPQLSLRTLEPMSEIGPARFHCKLPLGVQTTSAERTVSPQSVSNGPRISSLISDLVEQESLPVRVLRETSGACLNPEYRNLGGEIARHLGVLIRDNPSVGAEGTNSGWLCSALCSKPSFGRDHLITQWVRFGFRQSGGHTLLHDWVQTFWRRYCQALLTPTVTLMAKFGVALEAHSQNTLLDFDSNGLPHRIQIRDFGGVRIHLETLANAGHSLDFFPDSATETAEWQGAVNKFVHTVFQMHLTDVLQAFQADGHVVETPWETAYQCLESVYQTQALEDAFKRDRPLICAPELNAKCLMKMRLLGVYRDYAYAPVPNPLAAFS